MVSIDWYTPLVRFSVLFNVVIMLCSLSGAREEGDFAVFANANDSRLDNSVRSRKDFVNKNVFLNLIHVTNA